MKKNDSKVFCSYCGKSEEQLKPGLNYFTVWENKLACVECWKIFKYTSEKLGGRE